MLNHPYSQSWRITIGVPIIVAAVACADRGPTDLQRAAPDASASQRRPAERPVSQVVRGRAIVTVRRFGGGTIGGLVLRQDTGTYQAVVEEDGVGMATVSLPDGDVVVPFSRPIVRGASRVSSERRIRRSADGAQRSVRLTTTEGGAAVEAEFRRDGATVGRAALAWRRTEGAYELREYVSTIIAHGAPVASITVHLEDPRTVNPAAAPSPAARISIAPIFQVASASQGGRCDGLIYAMEDAFITYETAALALTGCLDGPWPCTAPCIAALAATVRLEVAENRAISCLEGAAQ